MARISFIAATDVKLGVERIPVFACYMFYGSLQFFLLSKVAMIIFALKIKKITELPSYRSGTV